LNKKNNYKLPTKNYKKKDYKQFVFVCVCVCVCVRGATVNLEENACISCQVDI